MGVTDWRKFWNSYRKKEVESEDDLFIEVGKTVQGRPISRKQFEVTIARIIGLLDLSPNDKLLELCCGNGLMTRALAPSVAEIEAIDFSEDLIAHARERSCGANVRYVCGDVLEHLSALTKSRCFIPAKVLLGDALAYFEPATFSLMLERITRLTNNSFLFLATNIPADELKWNFYNSAERKQHFEENQRRADNTNDGLGRWWKESELRDIARRLGLELHLEQPSSSSDYRLDALFKSPMKIGCAQTSRRS